MTRVQIPAYRMMGDRYGEIVRTDKRSIRGLYRPGEKLGSKTEIATVRLDKSGKTVRVILADCEVV